MMYIASAALLVQHLSGTGAGFGSSVLLYSDMQLLYHGRSDRTQTTVGEKTQT